MSACATVLLVVFGLTVKKGNNPNAPLGLVHQFKEAGLTALIGFLAFSFSILWSVALARLNRLKLWANRGIVLSRRHGFWPPRSILGENNDLNYLVGNVLVILFIALDVAYFVVGMQFPNDPPIWYFITTHAVILGLYPLLALKFSRYVSRELAARSAIECWPADEILHCVPQESACG